ncbi:hypothetical protein CGI42_28350, partial [Vibrio parahaemolyticus]|uniref:hypothetical protein n=1 Tax=Vibrio parahaemolyticus TaxID=670 RepID=UPI001167A611
QNKNLITKGIIEKYPFRHEANHESLTLHFFTKNGDFLLSLSPGLFRVLCKYIGIYYRKISPDGASILHTEMLGLSRVNKAKISK